MNIKQKIFVSFIFKCKGVYMLTGCLIVLNCLSVNLCLSKLYLQDWFTQDLWMKVHPI